MDEARAALVREADAIAESAKMRSIADVGRVLQVVPTWRAPFGFTADGVRHLTWFRVARDPARDRDACANRRGRGIRPKDVERVDEVSGDPWTVSVPVLHAITRCDPGLDLDKRPEVQIGAATFDALLLRRWAVWFALANGDIHVTIRAGGGARDAIEISGGGWRTLLMPMIPTEWKEPRVLSQATPTALDLAMTGMTLDAVGLCLLAVDAVAGGRRGGGVVIGLAGLPAWRRAARPIPSCRGWVETV